MRNLKMPGGRLPLRRFPVSPSLLIDTVSVSPVSAMSFGVKDVNAGAGNVPVKSLSSRNIETKAGALYQSLGRVPIDRQ